MFNTNPHHPSSWRPQHFTPPIPNSPAPVGMRPPPPQPFKFNPQPNHPFQNRVPNRTQQMFRALPQSYNPNSNVFRLPAKNNVPQNLGPKPMSGVQHFTPKPMLSGHDWRRSGNPPPNNYFKSREMNVNECAAYEDSYYTDGYCYEPEYYYNDYSDYSPYGILECDTETTYYDTTEENNFVEEVQPQASNSHSDKDFQERRLSKKLK